MSSSVTVISGYLNLKKLKGTTKASTCNFYLSITDKKFRKNSQKLRTQWTTFYFKNKTYLYYSTQQANDTYPKNEKKWQASSGKKDSSQDIFTSFLTTAREMAKG